MDLDIEDTSLPVYQALANPVRLELLRLLFHTAYTATDLAQQLSLSKPAVSKNLHILADAGLLRFQQSIAAIAAKWLSSPSAVIFMSKMCVKHAVWLV